MRWITHLGGAWATIGSAVLLVALGEVRLGLAVFVATASSQLVVQILKRAVARPRPTDPEGRPLALVKLPDPFSFPSGHSATITAVTVTICLDRPILAPVLLPIAALVAASRVTLRVHYVGDVLAGASIGLAGAILSAVLILY
jgi:undecaprenyl-diphosphatase